MGRSSGEKVAREMKMSDYIQKEEKKWRQLMNEVKGSQDDGRSDGNMFYLFAKGMNGNREVDGK